MKKGQQYFLTILILVAAVIAGAGVLYVRLSPPSPQTADGSQLRNKRVPETTTGKEYSVVLNEAGFEPREITIHTGDTVVFTTTRGMYFWPASNLHPTHGIYPDFDPQEPIAPEKSWKFRFNKTGMWRYHDHLRAYYIGIVQVVE